MEKHGIKETKEAITGGFALAGLFIEHFKDGIQPSDALSIFLKIQSDERFKEAVDGIAKVPAEATDLSIDEILDLGTHTINESRKLLVGIFKR